MRESVIRMIGISIIYAAIEAYFPPANQGDVLSPYHFLIFLIGVIAGFDRNIYIWIANTISYTVLEDAFYWLLRFELPYQWGKEYIVVYHIPIYYIPYSIVAMTLYLKGMGRERAGKGKEK
jgi:hypothetical protein